MIDVRISAQQRGPLRINHPSDLRLRMRLTNRRHRRQCVHDIAERTRLDDENRFIAHTVLPLPLILRLNQEIAEAEVEEEEETRRLSPQLQAFGKQPGQAGL